MNCPEFLAGFSEYRDGLAHPELEEEAREHLSRCALCRKYLATFEEGIRLIRSLPPLDLPLDFHPRLDHRIYHLEDGAAIARSQLGTGATTLSVLAVALLLSLAAWAPIARGPGTELRMASRLGAPSDPASAVAPSRNAFPRGPSLFNSSTFQDEFWSESHQLLFEYSSLSERRRGGAAQRTGLE